MALSSTACLLKPGQTSALREVLTVFAKAFEDETTYLSAQPGDAYLDERLADASFLAIAGFSADALVGGLVGYLLRKCEQQRSEIYIYDLAVLEGHRRRGVATAMIEALKAVAAERGAYVIYVQADYGDDAAIALYTKLGTREDVMHFDIQPSPSADRPLRQPDPPR